MALMSGKIALFVLIHTGLYTITLMLALFSVQYGASTQQKYPGSTSLG